MQRDQIRAGGYTRNGRERIKAHIESFESREPTDGRDALEEVVRQGERSELRGAREPDNVTETSGPSGCG